MMYWLSLLMLIVLASAQPPARVDAAWAFNGLCLRGAGIPAYTALMHAAVAAFMVADAETILFMLVMEPSFTTGRLHPHATIFLEMTVQERLTYAPFLERWLQRLDVIEPSIEPYPPLFDLSLCYAMLGFSSGSSILPLDQILSYSSS